MGKRYIKRLENLAAQSAVGVSVAINVSDFEHITFALAGSNTSVLTVKLQGSLGNTAPTFSTAKALGNEWDYVQAVNYEDGSPLDGDTGIVFTADDVRQFAADVEGLDFISFEIPTAGHTTGSVTPKVVCYSNS